MQFKLLKETKLKKKNHNSAKHQAIIRIETYNFRMPDSEDFFHGASSGS